MDCRPSQRFWTDCSTQSVLVQALEGLVGPVRSQGRTGRNNTGASKVLEALLAGKTPDLPRRKKEQ